MAQSQNVVERLHSREGKPSGPWDDEPDQIAWVDPDTDYPCLMVRNMFGSWCGYVAVPSGHIAHDVSYSDDLLDEIEVHGGLTYAGACAGGPGGEGCRVEGEKVWWLGFDTGHCYDWNWMMAEFTQRVPDVPDHPWPVEYRDVGYVLQEVSRLAQQLRVLDQRGEGE